MLLPSIPSLFLKNNDDNNACIRKNIINCSPTFALRFNVIASADFYQSRDNDSKIERISSRANRITKEKQASRGVDYQAHEKG